MLSPSMDSELDTLKRTLAEQDLYTPPSPHFPASHDDATLLSVFSALLLAMP